MNLQMITHAHDNCTTGILTVNGHSFYTIEQPWHDNKIGESCVPAGVYRLIPYSSPTHGATYCLENSELNIYGPGPFPVGGRSYCEIHSANWARQLEGCIALGLEGQPMFDPVTKLVEPAVENSRDAVDALFKIINVGVTGHTLTITRGS
jgi:hypothetical protein